MQILSVDEMGEGIKPIRPQSLVDMMKVGLHDSLYSPSFPNLPDLPVSSLLRSFQNQMGFGHSNAYVGAPCLGYLWGSFKRLPLTS